MFYEKRAYSIREYASAAELAEAVTGMSWCLCNGFRLGDILYLNDSSSENGAQEFAVLRCESESDAGWMATPFESLTFGWMDREKAEGYIASYEDPERVLSLMPTTPRHVLVRRHPKGSCQLCA